MNFPSLSWHVGSPAGNSPDGRNPCYLFFSYNRHSTAERHSQCSHIRSDVVYKNHNKGNLSNLPNFPRGTLFCRSQTRTRRQLNQLLPRRVKSKSYLDGGPDCVLFCAAALLASG